MQPPPTLTTSRLRLREPDDSDAPAIHDIHRHKPVADGVLSIPHPHTLADARAWLAKQRTPPAEGRLNYVWVICLADSGEPIGDCGIHIDLRHRRGVLGYLIRPDHWGRGIATEAIGAVLDLVFNQLAPPLIRVEADHYPENPASGRVLQKLGFEREGVLRSYIIKDGLPRDAVRWSRINAPKNKAPNPQPGP
jgi:ribosomal-protein-alanine N-acetyltransferase